MTLAAQHDPGGKTKWQLLPGMNGRASISDCGRYRHWLSRVWLQRDDLDSRRFALWIGANPSTASSIFDDPTIRREIVFTQHLGLDGLFKCNVMDYRATKPKVLLAPGVVPRSDENIPTIRKLAFRCSKIIVAYGSLHPKLAHYADDVVRALQNDGRKLWCLGFTAGGHPKHPLYVKGDTELVQFSQ